VKIEGKTVNDTIPPLFPGHEEENALYKYLWRELRYPTEAKRAGIQGEVKVRFKVTKRGIIEDVRIVSGIFPLCDIEAKRMVYEMPKWIAGEKDGEKVDAYVTLPILFRIDYDTKEYKETVYILDGKETGAEELYNLFTQKSPASKAKILKNSLLLEKDGLKRYEGKYIGKRVLELSFDETSGFDSSNPKYSGVIASPDMQPVFPGGEKDMAKFINKNLVYPYQAKKEIRTGRVILQFIVKKTGELSDTRIAQGFDPACNAEARRVIESMPRWTPGKLNGENVDSFYLLPISFNLK
jgi:TonB family protein